LLNLKFITLNPLASIYKSDESKQTQNGRVKRNPIISLIVFKLHLFAYKINSNKFIAPYFSSC